MRNYYECDTVRMNSVLTISSLFIVRYIEDHEDAYFGACVEPLLNFCKNTSYSNWRALRLIPSLYDYLSPAQISSMLNDLMDLCQEQTKLPNEANYLIFQSVKSCISSIKVSTFVDTFGSMIDNDDTHIKNALATVMLFRKSSSQEECKAMMHDGFISADPSQMDNVVSIACKNNPHFDFGDMFELNSDDYTTMYLRLITRHFGAPSSHFVEENWSLLVEADLAQAYKSFLIIFHDYPKLFASRFDEELQIDNCLNEVERIMLPEPVLLGLCKCFTVYPESIKMNMDRISDCLTQQFDCYSSMIGNAFLSLQKQCNKKQEWQELLQCCNYRVAIAVKKLIASAKTLFDTLVVPHKYKDVQIAFLGS